MTSRPAKASWIASASSCLTSLDLFEVLEDGIDLVESLVYLRSEFGTCCIRLEKEQEVSMMIEKESRLGLD